MSICHVENLSKWQYVMWRNFSTWQIFSPRAPPVVPVTNIKCEFVTQLQTFKHFVNDDDHHFQLWGKPFDEHWAKQRWEYWANIPRETETGFLSFDSQSLVSRISQYLEREISYLQCFNITEDWANTPRGTGTICLLLFLCISKHINGRFGWWSLFKHCWSQDCTMLHLSCKLLGSKREDNKTSSNLSLTFP